MSNAGQLWQYTEEAMLWAFHSKTEEEKQALIELARTWALGALQSDGAGVVNDSPPEHRGL